MDLKTLRERSGLTQAELASRLGMSQSDLSKLERRGDVRVSSLRSYMKGLGGRLRIVFQAGRQWTEVGVRRRSGATRSPADR